MIKITGGLCPKICWLLAGLAAAFSAPVNAQNGANDSQARAVVSVGHGYSDNVGRDTADNDVSSSFNALRLNFLLNRDRPRFDANFGGNVYVRRYADVPAGTDDDDVRGVIDGSLVASLIPNILTWDFRESFGQILQNPFDADRLGNRERVTVFTTGPQLNLPLGQRMFLQATAQVGQRSFEKSEALDSDTSGGTLGVVRTLNPVSQIGLQLTTSEVEYDSSQSGFEIDSAYLTYSRELATGGVQISLGGSEVTIAEQSHSTALIRFAWNRDVGARSNLSVFGGQEYTDAGALFRTGSGVSGVNGFGSPGGFGGGGLFDLRRLEDARLRDVISATNPLERSNLTIGWRISGQRTNIFLSTGLWQDRYEVDNGLDNDGSHADLEISREFTQRWSGQIGVRAYRRDFKVAAQEDDNVVTRLTTSYQIGVRAGISFEYRRYSRDQRDAPGRGYDDAEYVVFFNYTFGR